MHGRLQLLHLHLQRTHIPALPDTTLVPAIHVCHRASPDPKAGWQPAPTERQSHREADLHREGDVQNQGGRGTRLIDTDSFQHNFTGWLLPR